MNALTAARVVSLVITDLGVSRPAGMAPASSIWPPASPATTPGPAPARRWLIHGASPCTSRGPGTSCGVAPLVLGYSQPTMTYEMAHLDGNRA
jgi:hypothetical protein